MDGVALQLPSGAVRDRLHLPKVRQDKLKTEYPLRLRLRTRPALRVHCAGQLQFERPVAAHSVIGRDLFQRRGLLPADIDSVAAIDYAVHRADVPHRAFSDNLLLAPNPGGAPRTMPWERVHSS